MKKAYLLKNGDIGDFPAELYIEDKKIEYVDFVSCLSDNNVKIIFAKSLPSDIIYKLRQNGIIFLKVKSLDEIDNINVNLGDEVKIKRGWGCQRRLK